MATYYSLASKKSENEILTASVRKYAGRYIDENWSFISNESFVDSKEFLKDEPVIDIMSWDTTVKDALDNLDAIRKQYPVAAFVLLADSTISPLKYLRPGIRADALLFKPLNRESCDETFDELLSMLPFVGKEDGDAAMTFLAESREGKQFIPYSQIDLFEARQKKLFVRTRSEEFGFYGSLDELETELPKEFMRCHRSYIINTSRIKAIFGMENMIELMDGVRVPFSRRYRKVVKDYGRNQG